MRTVTAMSPVPTSSRYEAHLRTVLDRAPGTMSRYLDVVRAFEDYLAVEGVGKQLENAHRDDVETFLVERASGSASTWNVSRAALASMFQFLMYEGTVADNPAKSIPSRKRQTKERVPLSLDEMLRFVDAVDRHAHPSLRARDKTIALLLLHCGLRVAEVLSLSVVQVDMENRVLLGVLRKGGKSLAAFFNDVVAEALDEHLLSVVVSDPSAPLFVARTGSRLSTRSVQKAVKRYAALAGLSRPVTPHDLRHSSATQFGEIGTDLRVVQELLGHQSIRTTQIYIHPARARRFEAVTRFGNVWQERRAEQATGA